MKYPKIIKYSLTGGTALTATIFGSLKLSENIAYNRKIARYEQIAKDFSKFGLVSDDLGGWYLPRHNDNEAWKTTHENKGVKATKKEEGEKFLREHPNWETFRDSCYENADKGVSFNWTNGWGSERARQTDWELEKERKARQNRA